MKKYQNAGRITPGHNGVFPGHAADIDRDELHVVSYRPNRADIVEALTPPGPPDRSWLGTQQRADGLDFALSHCLSLPAGKPTVGDASNGSSGWVSPRSHRIAVKTYYRRSQTRSFVPSSSPVHGFGVDFVIRILNFRLSSVHPPCHSARPIWP